MFIIDRYIPVSAQTNQTILRISQKSSHNGADFDHWSIDEVLINTNYYFTSNSVADSLPAGTYYVTATDNNSCQRIDSVVITEPAAISVTLTGTNPGCGNSDGSLNTNINGGTGPFNYHWSDASQQTTAIATNLSSGSYSVTVTDNLNCRFNSKGSLSDSLSCISVTFIDATFFGYIF